ncbi:HlyU family transcriptional regulator [Fulvimarina sp. 2208YS6-2-32]|uniref:HlyU family transcriptional regulator n=1 Tax=Fulvimarina uroteuthidis TaxID=3098149 RepID=A0ABU5I697_9HYPH|nr:HlyU family transcriptional regulator [Fulvimarina sp. 2208YS6-2-32]MDY8109671.1 HlyU family transcriptional regulator [Fulvimarina sp. 2208YS6-2-32]
MSFLKRLFGGGSSSEPAPDMRGDPERYEGFTITSAPMPEGGQFRLSALIEKTVEGKPRAHRLIRADLFPSRAEADAAALRKARRVIDEQGDRLFS